MIRVYLNTTTRVSFKELQGLIEELLGSLKGILGFLGLLKGVKAKATHPKPHEGRS